MSPTTDAAVASAYDARAAEYVERAGDLAQMDPRDAAEIAAWREATTGVLLDVGCGPGHWTEFLTQGGRTARGMDLSVSFITSARRRHPGIRFEVGSARELPVDSGTIGGILAWYSLIHLPPADLPTVLSEFARVLAPGGSVLVGFFDGEPRREFAHAVAPAYFWSTSALSAVVEDAGFEILSRASRGRAPGELSARPHGSLRARTRPGTLVHTRESNDPEGRA